MIRPTVRSLSVLALILALSVVLVAPAEARPIPRDSPPSSEESREEPSWLDAALFFVSGLLPKALTLPELPRLPLLFDPGTGSCIDPQGNPCVFVPGLF